MNLGTNIVVNYKGADYIGITSPVLSEQRILSIKATANGVWYASNYEEAYKPLKVMCRDALIYQDTDIPLSANQGYVLNDKAERNRRNIESLSELIAKHLINYDNIKSKVYDLEQEDIRLDGVDKAIQANVDTLTNRVDNHDSEIQNLKDAVITSETPIGKLTGETLPKKDQLNQFVYDNTKPNRNPRINDTIIFTQIIAGGTDKSYKYIYNSISDWNYYDIPLIESATNDDKGIIQGTKTDDNYNLIVNIIAGKISDIKVLDRDLKFTSITKIKDIYMTKGDLGNKLDKLPGAFQAYVNDAFGNPTIMPYVFDSNKPYSIPAYSQRGTLNVGTAQKKAEAISLGQAQNLFIPKFSNEGVYTALVPVLEIGAKEFTPKTVASSYYNNNSNALVTTDYRGMLSYLTQKGIVNNDSSYEVVNKDWFRRFSTYYGGHVYLVTLIPGQTIKNIDDILNMIKEIPNEDKKSIFYLSYSFDYIEIDGNGPKYGEATMTEQKSGQASPLKTFGKATGYLQRMDTVNYKDQLVVGTTIENGRTKTRAVVLDQQYNYMQATAQMQLVVHIG